MTGNETVERLRVDGYIRVSSVGMRRGNRFISPVVQREQIEAWVHAHGAELVEVYEEFDESGRRPDRPLLQEAIRRIESGATQGLVVATVSRFGRNELDGLLAIKRVQDAGGHFISATENLDLADDVGRYFCRELLSIAELESDRLGRAWRQAKQKMIERGAYPASGTPFGYRRTRSGRLTPDPRTAPYVTELFRRRAAGESFNTLSRFLESAGVKTAHGDLGWTRSTLSQIVQRRAYLGEIHWGAIVRTGVHRPLTDGATWQRAQRPRDHDHTRARQAGLLTGLLRCASCCMAMHRQYPWTPRGRVYTVYVCSGRSAGGPCPARAYVHAPLLGGLRRRDRVRAAAAAARAPAGSGRQGRGAAARRRARAAALPRQRAAARPPRR